MLRRAKAGAASFGLFGLVGPVLQLLVGLVPDWNRWSTSGSIVTGLVTLLWPVRLLAMGTTSTSNELLLLLVVGNVLLFAVLGAVAGLSCSSPRAVGLLSVGAVLAILFVSRFLVGSFSLARTWVVVIVALTGILAILWRLPGGDAAEKLRG